MVLQADVELKEGNNTVVNLKKGTILLLTKKLIHIISKSVLEHFYFIQKMETGKKGLLVSL